MTRESILSDSELEIAVATDFQAKLDNSLTNGGKTKDCMRKLGQGTGMLEHCRVSLICAINNTARLLFARKPTCFECIFNFEMRENLW